jgi:VCBS repeat protein
MSRREQLFTTFTVILVSICLAVPASAGSFQAAGHFQAASHPVAIAAGDFDGNGIADLAVVNSNHTVSVFSGVGDGSFRDRVDQAIGIDGRSIVIADINGDGKSDIAVGDAGTKSVSILLGRGDGSFQAHSESSAAQASIALVALLNNQKTYRTASQSVSVVFADFNRDGLLDQAVTTTRDDRVSVLLGTRNPDSAQTPTTNLLQNSGFESGSLSPWVQGRNFCSTSCRNWAVSTFRPFAGTDDAGDEGNIEIVQNFTPTSTSSLTKVGVWDRHPAGSEPTAADFFYSDGTDDEFVFFTSDSVWDPIDLTSDLESGKMLSGFSIFGFGGGGNINMNTFIDNVMIR